jgi:Tol biopolymer transport system component
MYDLMEKKFTPLLTSEFSEWIGTFSPDGRWFTYQSNETGKYEIYIRPTDGSPSKWQVSTNGGEQPRWVSNGTEIIYNVNDQQFISVPVTVTDNQITVGTARTLFRIDGGFQTKTQDISKDGKKFLLNRTLNTRSLNSASIIFNWQNLVEKK